MPSPELAMDKPKPPHLCRTCGERPCTPHRCRNRWHICSHCFFKRYYRRVPQPKAIVPAESGAPAAELLPPEPPVAASDNALFQPWLLPREVAEEILALIPLVHRRKWARYFERWGCIACGRGRENVLAHYGCGFCGVCHNRIQYRLSGAIKQAQADREGER